MVASRIEPPVLAFLDAAGKPLENGYIYIGQPGFEAVSTPKQAYFDSALTIPAPPFVRTTGGYPVSNGTPARIYVDGDYSITVLDKNGVRVSQSLTQVFPANLFPDGTLAAAGFGFVLEPNSGFIRSGAGTVQQTVLGLAVQESKTTEYRTLVPLVQTTQATLTAGTNAQGQGLITADKVLITTAASNPSGATLPVGILGAEIVVTNTGANPVNVYPAVGGQINTLGVNNPISLPVGQSMTFLAFGATAWRAIREVPPLVAGQFLKGNVAGTALEFGRDDFELFSSDSLAGLSTFDKTGLSIFRDLMVVLINSTVGVATSRQLRIGNSGGVLSTAIYRTQTNALNTELNLSDSSVAGRVAVLQILNFNTTNAHKPVLFTGTSAAAGAPAVISEASAFDRIQQFNSAGTVHTTCTLEIYGRR